MILSNLSIINTPHNPVGKVFTTEELKAIGDVAEEYNLLIIADEVVRLIGLSFSKLLTIYLCPHTHS